MSHSPLSRDDGADANDESRDVDGKSNDTDRVGSDRRRIKVGVGELAVATDGETLTTSGLGSCVAVALTDEHAGVRGLLHAMLPADDGANRPTARPGKYVDSGIDALIATLREAGAKPGRLEARIAGGAEMLDLTDAVGPRNVESVECHLDTAGISIVGSDVGDDVGRTVRFCADSRLTVRAADGFERTL